MAKDTGIHLPQLPNKVVAHAKKTRLDAFAVALEGWRRGLTLKWYTKDSGKFDDMIVFGVNPPGRLYSLSNGEKTHYFFRTRGDKVANQAVEIGSEKGETKRWLDRAGVPVPQGAEFDRTVTDEQILEYAKNIEFPVVLKPTNASLGNGVITNLKSIQALKEALEYVRQELGYKEVIVEQYVPGKEYRVYVVHDQVIAAYNREPANIVGDGEHTIEELIQRKNNLRKKNARLHSCLIHMDKEIMSFIKEYGYDLTSVPPEGKLIYLREKTNVSSGGDPIDVTDELPEEFKTVAINAVKAVPNLHHCGVDIIVNPNKPVNEAAVVIELNPTAQIGGALYPISGKSRNIPGAIIDYYFPETKGIDTTNNKFYFDLNDILEPLESRSVVEIEVAPAPQGDLYAKKYTLAGAVQKTSYHQYIKKQALDRGLIGSIDKNAQGQIEVIVGGTDRDQVDQFKDILTNSDLAQVAKIKEEIYDDFIKIGFDIYEKFEAKTLKSAETMIKKAEKELERLMKEREKMERANRNIVESTSWKYTKPVRAVSKMLKNSK